VVSRRGGLPVPMTGLLAAGAPATADSRPAASFRVHSGP
jgi:hypothetical protein